MQREKEKRPKMAGKKRRKSRKGKKKSRAKSRKPHVRYSMKVFGHEEFISSKSPSQIAKPNDGTKVSRYPSIN